eukprot:COSAG03_NODE_524_length_7177_cov_6.485872_5_plen_62_part_00
MSLLFLSGNSVCWVSPLTDGGRTLARRGRYGDTSTEGGKQSVAEFGRCQSRMIIITNDYYH